MKKNLSFWSLNLLIAFLPLNAQITPTSQMEYLGRGVVVIPNGKSGEFISWRFLGTDDEEKTSFDILRDGEVIKEDITNATSYSDTKGKSTNKYQVVTKFNGTPIDTTEAVSPWTNNFYQLHLDRPAPGSDYTYSPADCSLGDVDGDGEYEIFVKWDPSNAKDNSQSGKTGNVYIDCYKTDWAIGGEGTTPEKLWRIDLGVNIRAGAHYTQFMVYDFNGDGLAEMICKTAPGSKDGTGNYVSSAGTDSKIKNTNNSKDWRNGEGKIDGGYEFLTAFDGLTGKAIHTVFYKPNRNAQTSGSEATGSFNWDDRSGKKDYAGYGNRGERYLACVAYLDGPESNPHAIFSRGYYTFAYIWAVSFDGKEIKDKWFHSSHSKTQYKVTDSSGRTRQYNAPIPTSGSGSRTMYGNGNHNLSVGDVDADGCDEIIWGSAALDNDGKILYATGYGHGDAIHLADHNPDRPGLEVFQIHEGSPYGWDLHDAATGEILFSATGSKDNGRGIAAQLSSTHRGSYFSSSNDSQQRSAVTGKVESSGSTSMNFRIFWDGTLQEELFDGGKIDMWNGSSAKRLFISGKNPYDYNSSSTCNGSKSTPNIQADLFGDWREEIILWNSSNGSTLNVFTTYESTKYRVPTLMHDHLYRMGIAWQNVAYNQPPHLGYYLPDRYAPTISFENSVLAEQTVELGDSITPIVAIFKNSNIVNIDSTIINDKKIRGLANGFEREISYLEKRMTLKGKPDTLGKYTFLFRISGSSSYSSRKYIHAVINVVESTGLNTVENTHDKIEMNTPVYDLQGRLVGRYEDFTNNLIPKGIYIVNKKKIIIE